MTTKRSVSQTLAVLLLALTCAFAGSACAQAADANQYQAITPPQPTSTSDRIEVVEMFWYGCPHCYTFEPYLERWLSTKPDDVVFVRIPAVFSPNWEAHARAYFVAETLGVVDQTHRPLFDAIHRDHNPLLDEQSLAQFFAAHGLTERDFHKAYDSFAVNGKIARAKQLSRDYQISGVPSVIVNGKYRTSATLAGSYDNLLKVVDELIDKERAATATAAPR